jgi:hypothetical protein
MPCRQSQEAGTFCTCPPHDMIIAENVQKGWFFLKFRFLSPGHDVIVPFFPDYQENDSKEPIDYDQWHDGG